MMLSSETNEPSPTRRYRSVEARLPASTSNLGPGFDCFGLALRLYLTIRATLLPQSADKCRIRIRGDKENANLPRTTQNLIYRAMAYVAGHEGLEMMPLRLAISNDIPISRGLGGSAAAIVGGIKAWELLFDRPLTDEKVLRYAADLEGHADNIAATLLGGFVVTCFDQTGKVIAVKQAWPRDLHVIIVSPDPQLETRLARATLPKQVSRLQAVFNLQRSALFNAALVEHRYELLWEAMQDRLHQHKRQSLVPGLADALALPKMPGLLGVALSGAGPSVLAIAHSNLDQIGDAIVRCFAGQQIHATVRKLEIDEEGCRGRVLT